MANRRAKLNAREEAFCRNIIQENCTGTKAAINAGYSPKTARAQASTLLTKQNIQTEIARLRSLVEKKALWTLEQTVQKAIDIAEDAHNDKQYAPAVAAVNLIGKYTGAFTDRVDHTTKGERINPINIYIPHNDRD